MRVDNDIPHFPPSSLVQDAVQRLEGQIMPWHRALDVGCYAGRNSLLLAGVGFSEVHGIDTDREGLQAAERHARRLGARACNFSEVDFIQQSKQLGEYELVLANEVFSGLKKPAIYDMLSDVQQHTVRGGHNIISGYMWTPELMTDQNRKNLLRPGELAQFYHDTGWTVLKQYEQPGPTYRTPSDQELTHAKTGILARKR